MKNQIKKFIFFVSNNRIIFRTISHQVFILFALIAVAVAESTLKAESEPAPVEEVVESEPAEVEAVTESVAVEVEYVNFDLTKLLRYRIKYLQFPGPSAIQLRL